MDKRITKKANYSKKQKTKLETFWSKGNMGAEISQERDFQQSLGEVDLDAILLLTVCGEVRNTEQNR